VSRLTVLSKGGVKLLLIAYGIWKVLASLFYRSQSSSAAAYSLINPMLHFQQALSDAQNSQNLDHLAENRLFGDLKFHTTEIKSGKFLNRKLSCGQGQLVFTDGKDVKTENLTDAKLNTFAVTLSALWSEEIKLIFSEEYSWPEINKYANNLFFRAAIDMACGARDVDSWKRDKPGEYLSFGLNKEDLERFLELCLFKRPEILREYSTGSLHEDVVVFRDVVLQLILSGTWLNRWFKAFKHVRINSGNHLLRGVVEELKLSKPEDVILIALHKVSDMETVLTCWDQYVLKIQHKTSLEITELTCVLAEDNMIRDFFDEKYNLEASSSGSSLSCFLAVYDISEKIGSTNEAPAETVFSGMKATAGKGRPFGGTINSSLESRAFVNCSTPSVSTVTPFLSVASQVWSRGLSSWSLDKRILPIYNCNRESDIHGRFLPAPREHYLDHVPAWADIVAQADNIAHQYQHFKTDVMQLNEDQPLNDHKMASVDLDLPGPEVAYVNELNFVPSSIAASRRSGRTAHIPGLYGGSRSSNAFRQAQANR